MSNNTQAKVFTARGTPIGQLMRGKSAILELIVATETQNGFEMTVVAGPHAQDRVGRRCDGADKQGGRQQG
jgi:hypothetical protein